MIRTEWACLELTKTVGWEERDPPGDRLIDYDALIEWAVARGELDASEAATIREAAKARPEDATRVLRRTVALRALFYRIFSAIGAGRTPRPSDIEALNEVVSEANRRLRIVPAGDGYGWSWTTEGSDPLERVVWPLVRSAADLLTSGDELERVRLCDADDCGWLFIDASRNRSRRWCDMSGCGNRAKARRYRARRRSGGR